jgi:hypothetical protein
MELVRAINSVNGSLGYLKVKRVAGFVTSNSAPGNTSRSSSVLLLEIAFSGLRFEDEISKTARRRRHFVAMHYVPDLNKINLACDSCHHGGNVSVSGSSADSPDTCL